jgi:cytochrome c oxidase subunit 3/cytochrome c oxidase subunit I+III
MEATDAAGSAYVAQRRRALPNGWWGMAVFLATEAALFGSMIGSYFYLRFTSAQWPQGGIERPSVALPLVLTAALVATSAPMAAATAAARRGRARAAWLAILAAALVQGGYLAVQIVEYLDDLHKFSPSTNAYGSIYFTLLGAHHAHVAIGLLLDLWLLARLLGGLTNYRVIAVRSIALYWYVVSAIGICVVATQVSAA